MKRGFFVALPLAAAFLVPLVHADYRDTIGHTALLEELGLRGLPVPTGAGIVVTQVEAREDTDRDGTLEPNEGYAPNPADSQFGSVTINDVSNLGQDPSGHATTVGRNLYGSASSMAAGIAQADVYEAGDWLGDWGSGTPPTETNPLQNHSWVNFTSSSTPSRIMDFAVNRDGFLPIAGLYNSDFGPPQSSDIPEVYGSIYNGIAVGRSDGGHVTGVTSSADGPGRVKPEIVAPGLSSGTRFTSFVTPFVTATAALLLEEASAYGADADEPETLKAILLAAASKAPFPSWDQTSSRPIDAVYGAGELDVYEAYWIQRAGEQPEGSAIGRRGWNFTSIGGGGTHAYTLTVPAGFELRELSALLTWNRQVTQNKQGRFYTYTPSLADLALRLKQGGGTLQASDSSVDNIEHIWRDEAAALPAGSYSLEVTSTAGVDYALAWRSELYQDYALWKTAAFTGATPVSERDPEDDPEADGIPNRLEQAFGGDPEAHDRSILPRMTIVEDGGSRYLELAVRRPVFTNELSYTVESSGDLEGAWSSPAPDFELVGIGPSGDPDFELHTYRRTTTVEAGGDVFVRVSVGP
jgi:hypothetical protein